MRLSISLAAVILVAAPLAAAAARGGMPASSFVAKTGASDLFERQSAALMTKSRNEKIRDFAAMMTRDHSKSTASVKAAAAAARIRVAPPALDRMQSRNLAALRAARGANRDRLYVDQQKAAHRDALMLQQNYAADGSARPLRAAALKIVPVVKHHIEMLAAM